MSKVWRRLQRVGKKAYKYRFFSQSHSLKLNCTNKWKAQKVCLVWSHRGRKHSSKVKQILTEFQSPNYLS